MIIKSKLQRALGAILVLYFVLLANTPVARADDFAPPPPFYILSEDGSRVFHFTPDDEWRDTNWWPPGMDDWTDLPPTGIYYNTDPLTPIYQIELPCWVIWEHGFFFSRDMQYFVWFPAANGMVAGVTGEVALVFYANGTVQRIYMVSDLVEDADTLIRTAMSVLWLDWPSREFDAEQNRLSFTTVDGVRYEFDITTGEIVTHSNQTSWFSFAAILAAGILGLSGGTLVLLAKRKHSK
ncbi:MAG: hypothetical protein FWC72_05130 [Oscillospiraceae bacterium]|nr:hypothetical protein [Oscillospiraceae bacterium]